MSRPTSGKYDNLSLSTSPSNVSAQNLSSSSSQNLFSHNNNYDYESIEEELTSKLPFSNNKEFQSKEDYTNDFGDDGSNDLSNDINTFSNDKDISDSNEDLSSDHFSSLESARIVTGFNGLAVSVISRRALHALLSSFYVRHGLMSQIALECISNLLIKTKFFDNEQFNSTTAYSTTLIDITVNVLCDRFDCCIESECDDILNVIIILIKKTKGALSLITIQRLIQSLSFLCNYYSSKSDWIKAGFNIPHTCITSKGSNGEEILEWIEISSLNVLNKLIRSILNRTENTGDIAMYLPDTAYNTYDYSKSGESYSLIHSLVYNFIEEVIDIVEVSHLSEESLIAISKQSTTILSTSFWQQINKLSLRLFKEKEIDLRNSFICLCSISKLAWNRVRLNEQGKATPRDIGSKLLALSSILEFCNNSGECLQRSKVFGYLIRRLVVPVLLNNMSYSLIDSSVFSMVLKIITSLWNYWRFHVRFEFATLTDQLIIKVLQASPAKIKPIYQMIVLDEVVQWFSQPQLLLEMFVNFDMDQRFVSQNEFSHLVRAVCLMARRTTTVKTTTCHRRPSMNDFTLTDPSIEKRETTVREVHLKALEQICRIAKTLMDATGHSYLISQDSNFREKATGVGTGWEEDAKQDLKSPRQRTVSNVNYLDTDVVLDDNDDNENRSIRSNSNRSGDNENEFVDNDNDVMKSTDNKGTGIKFHRAKHQQAEDLLTKSIEIYKEKDSLKKAVQFLIKNGFMPDTPQEIARFLRVYKNSFDPSAIGDFLGEGGLNPKEEEYWSQIRFRYTRAVSFVEMEIEPALRLYLTGCGFRLPGEGQKVDRFVEVFVKAYWLDNSGTQYCPFRHPDTVHLTGYAIIMLNTDLHRANPNKDKKGGREYKKMTKEQFINQLRGSDDGEDIDKDYLSRIYENILLQPIELAFESNEGGASKNLSSAPAITNYDNVVLDVNEEKLLVKEISRGIRHSEDLLRVMSPFHYKFQLTGVDTNISLDLVSFMYETVWFHFHAIIESLLKPTKNDFNPGNFSDDIYVTFSSLDILCYSLTSAIFLDLKVERMAFAEQLLKFKTDFELANEIIIDLSHCGSKDLDYSNWFELVEKASPNNAMETIAVIHKLLVVFKKNIQEKAAKDARETVLQRIEKKSQLTVLINNRYFVKEEDIFKKNRTGKLVKYRFFLFSDHLIYSHLSITGEYKIHSNLSLSLMDIYDDNNDCSLYISHPAKSFTIVFTSKALKNEWLSDLQYTIESCHRKERINSFNKSYNKLSEENNDDNQINDQINPYKTPLKETTNTTPLNNQSIQIYSDENIVNNRANLTNDDNKDITTSPTLNTESSPSKESKL